MASDQEYIETLSNQGVDPSMPEMANRQYAMAPSPRATMGYQSGASDPGIIAASANISQVTTAIQVLSSKIDTIVNAMNGSVQRMSDSVTGLAQMQAQQQALISRSQVSRQYAQAMNPDSYSSAPSIPYQTAPVEAIYRNPVNPVQAERQYTYARNMSQLPNSRFKEWYESPEATLFSGLKNWSILDRSKMPFSVDPYQMMADAKRRGTQSVANALDTVGEIGSDIAGSMLGGSMLFKGVAAVAGGPIAGGAMALDTVLSMVGLPSVSGTVGNATSAIYRNTLGIAGENVKKAATIQDYTQFYTGVGADVSGNGLGMRSATKMVSGLNSMAAGDYNLNKNDFMGIFQASADNGLLSLSGNEDKMLQDVKAISKNLRTFMRITGDPDYKSAVKEMGDLSRMGIANNQLGIAASNIQSYARMAGLSTSDAKVFGAQGAMAFQQAGASMGLGYQVGTMTRAHARLSAQSGAVSRGMLSSFGGEEGLSQSVMESQAAFMGGTGHLVAAGVSTINKQGQAEIDPLKLKNWEEGRTPLNAVIEQGRELMADDRVKEQLLTTSGKMKLHEKFSEALGPEGVTTGVVRTITQIMKQENLGYEAAAQVLLGDKAAAFTSVYNAQSAPGILEASKREETQRNFNKYAVAVKDRQLGRVASRGLSQAFEATIGSPMSGVSEAWGNYSQRKEEEAMGIYRSRERGSGIGAYSAEELSSSMSGAPLKDISSKIGADLMIEGSGIEKFYHDRNMTPEKRQKLADAIDKEGKGSLKKIISDNYLEVRGILKATPNIFNPRGELNQLRDAEVAILEKLPKEYLENEDLRKQASSEIRDALEKEFGGDETVRTKMEAAKAQELERSTTIGNKLGYTNLGRSDIYNMYGIDDQQMGSSVLRSIFTSSNMPDEIAEGVATMSPTLKKLKGDSVSSVLKEGGLENTPENMEIAALMVIEGNVGDAWDPSRQHHLEDRLAKQIQKEAGGSDKLSLKEARAKAKTINNRLAQASTGIIQEGSKEQKALAYIYENAPEMFSMDKLETITAAEKTTRVVDRLQNSGLEKSQMVSVLEGLNADTSTEAGKKKNQEAVKTLQSLPSVQSFFSGDAGKVNNLTTLLQGLPSKETPKKEDAPTEEISGSAYEKKSLNYLKDISDKIGELVGGNANSRVMNVQNKGLRQGAAMQG
jgi:hypothetical protein